MRLLTLIQAITLALGFSCVRAQSGPEPVKQYEVILYEGAAPESFPEEDGKDLKPEKPRLSMRVEEGEKFHAEGNGAMFEGKILSVKEGKVELKIERSRLTSTECDDISATMGLGEAVSPRTCGFQSIIFLYYFRVKSVAEDGRDGAEGVTSNIAMLRSAFQRSY
jgi:hypothetical protein